ncbi:hypothetical protein SY88_12485 [Clostridiales bacterium PH28_bin88]|nr:hypothetical protein SY88_12485 [Clostridiales bacterium PH28_bin88]
MALSLWQLKVGIVSHSAINWPMYIAIEKEFFARQGLKVEMRVTGSPIEQLVAMKKGGVYDIGHSAADDIIQAVHEGWDLCMVMGLNSSYFSVVTNPDISNYRYLNGVHFIPEYQGEVAVVQREWAHTYTEPLVGYIKGYILATDWLYDPGNRQEAAAILCRYIICSREEAEMNYQYYTEKRIFNTKAKVNFDGLHNLLKAMVELGEIPAGRQTLENYVDESFYHLALDQLEGR